MPQSESEALAIERRDLALLQCLACGLVFNPHFDPVSQVFSPGYEETQGFSPTFRRFAEGLVDQLCQRWSLANSTVLEIGCGKGEFLSMLCERSGCRGIGIDPAHDPARQPTSEKLHFEQRLFNREDIGLQADYLVCRHTLEHIGPVGDFLATVAEVCRAGQVREVFFEVPEASRIFSEGAFWDIYYEHANYFSAGALRNAFEQAGFEITSIETLFDDQYLGLYARPTDQPQRLGAESEAFSGRRLAESIRDWRQRVARTQGDIVIWGSGSKGVSFLSAVDPERRITAAVDINPYRQGRFMPGSGQAIVAPEVLCSIQPELVIVMNPIYRDEIAASIASLGLSPELVCT